MQAWVKLDHRLLAIDGEHDVHAMVEIAVPERVDANARVPRMAWGEHRKALSLRVVSVPYKRAAHMSSHER